MTTAGEHALTRVEPTFGQFDMAVDPGRLSALNLMREDRQNRVGTRSGDTSPNAPSGTNSDIVKRMGLADGSMLLCMAEPGELQDKVAQASDVASKVNLATGGKFANNPFYNPSMGALGVVTGVDVTPDFISGVVKASFDRLGDINRALSGNNKPAAYKPVMCDGKPAVIGAKDGYWGSPELTINIDKKDRTIDMNLPGFPEGSKNVALVTDGNHLLAIDTKTKGVWVLDGKKGVFGGYDFWWNKVDRK